MITVLFEEVETRFEELAVIASLGEPIAILKGSRILLLQTAFRTPDTKDYQADPLSEVEQGQLFELAGKCASIRSLS